MINEIVYVDFVQMDEFNGFDYVMSIVDGMSRFAQFVPCKKTVTAEQAVKMLFREWIMKFGKPQEVCSDNDVRFVSPNGWWQGVLKAFQIKVDFSQPRRPQSNGLCERINRSFLQNMRALISKERSRDWLKLIPICTFIMNAQLCNQTGFSPHKLFFGRPAWKMSVIPDPESHPQVQDWAESHMKMIEEAQERLKKIRKQALTRANKGRMEPSFQPGDYVLVHKKRFPQ